MSEDSGEQTCGKGLAQHATLPAKLGDVCAAMAELLRGHLESLVDDDDPAVRAEREAYQRLTDDFQRIAADLEATAARMAGYRTLPMAPHDFAVLGTRRAIERFASFVESEHALFDLLRTSLERDDEMLGTMRRA